MRRAACSILVAILFAVGAVTRPASGQTYNPKAVHFESTDPTEHLDSAELLRISGLEQGVPLTRTEIEAALQKLGDSGAFSNLSYTVNNTALTIRLTPAGGGQAVPVRFTNFVWWSHDELIRILEERVPLFHGTLPLQGNQTGEVEDALVALLRDKGVPDARITATPSSSAPGQPMNAVALAITSPEVLVGKVDFQGAIPAVAEKLTTLQHELADREFDLREVNMTIQGTAQEIFADAGYLDFTSDPPTYAPPRKDLGGYIIDVQVALHPGPLYRVATIALHPEPPLSDADLRAALPFKTGDPASASDLRVALAALARLYGDRAFLEARASAKSDKNVSSHTVGYSFTFSPGSQFRLASVDASGLPSDLQQQFAEFWHTAPGVLIDKAFQSDLRDALRNLHSHSAIFVGARRDPAAHTVVIVLQLRKPGVPSDPADPQEMNAPATPTKAQSP